MTQMKPFTLMVLLSTSVVGCENTISSKSPIEESDDIIIQDLDGVIVVGNVGQ